MRRITKKRIKKILEEIDRSFKRGMEFCKAYNFHNDKNYKEAYDRLMKLRLVLRKIAERKYKVKLKEI
jgi:DNA-binding TFAR19-related protein (PDSD5 family)